MDALCRQCDNVIRGNGGGIGDDDRNNFWVDAFQCYAFFGEKLESSKTTLERIILE